MDNNSAVKNIPTSDDKSKNVGSFEGNHKRRNILLGVILFVCVLALVSWLLLHFVINNKVVFSVNGTNYRQNTVNGLVEYPVQVRHQNKKAATAFLYELYQYRAAAEGVGITFTDSQLVEYRKDTGIKVYSQKNYEKYLNLIAFKSKAQEYIANYEQNNTQGHYEGYSYVFHFDETLSNGPGYKSPNYGNQALFQRDKKYAYEKAQSYRDQLKQGKITPQKALDDIQADPRLGYYYKPNNTYSAHFGESPDGNWQMQVFFPVVAKFIQSQSKPGISSIQTGKVPTVPNPTSSEDYTDGYYYFVDITKVDKPNDLGAKLQKKLADVKKHSKYYGES